MVKTGKSESTVGGSLPPGSIAGGEACTEVQLRGPIQPDGVLDTVGLFCPIPIIKTGARMRGMEEGQVLEVVSDDRVILVDLPNWCRGSGHEYLGSFEAAREIHLFVRKGVRKPSPQPGK
jgi:TusA-related sulfurtransferase